MNTNNKIAVIGGTGKSGKFLIKELLKQGYLIKMLVRNPERAPAIHPQIEVINGDVLDQNVVDLLLEECKAVISVLGWGIPASRNTISSEGTSILLKAMKMQGITRYVVVSGIHVDTTTDNKGFSTKAATEWMYEHYREVTIDRQVEYDLLRASKVDWTLVRLPLIILDDVNKEINVSLADCLGDQISATSLANFLIDQLHDRSYIRKAPFIANQ